ncbi:MAG: L,D-transpeptidase [Beijerinckiaceae bacterium]
MIRNWLAKTAALCSALMLMLIAAPASAGVDIKVNLNAQTMTATTPDGAVRHWKISSGREGYRTIRGTYRPYMLKTHHVSRKYGGAMPHAIFFKGGYAIHGTSAVGRLGAPASHGCIRLAPGNARELFALVKKHGQRSTRIAINGNVPDQGKTLYAAKKKKNTATQVARARTKVQPQMVVPAYAPIDVSPHYQPFWRLR